MLKVLKQWFVPAKEKRRKSSLPHRRSDNWDSWTRIGGYDYTTSNMENVPRWVRNRMRDMELTAASDGLYFELKGKRYRYRIVPRGHGAPIVNVLRRQRRGSR